MKRATKQEAWLFLPLIAVFLFGFSMTATAVVQYSYDALHRLTRVDYGNGRTITYTYDSAGNRLTLTAQAGPQPDSTAPAIQITQPTTERLFVTTASSVTLGGTASDATGIAALSCTNSVGAETAVAGTTSWTAGPISVSNGVNRLTVSASDPTGNVGRASLTVVVLPPATGSSVIFQDDFNDNSVGAAWIPSRNVVQEADQIMKVKTTVTDAGGRLLSEAFPISRTGIVTITRSVRVHYGNNYFVGYFKVAPGNLGAFNVHYANMDYSTSQYSACHGFYVGRNGQGPHSGPNRATDTIGPIPGIWDTWFDEKFTYDPVSGQLDYFINSTNQLSFAVGAMPSDGPATLSLDISAWGWFTGHEQLFDDLLITQAGDSAPADIRDTDGDGMLDWAELLAGTSETNPASFLALRGVTPSQATPDGVVLEWASTTGIYYSVNRATNLLVAPGDFVPIETGIPGLPVTTSYTDTNPPPASAFYRISVDY